MTGMYNTFDKSKQIPAAPYAAHDAALLLRVEALKTRDGQIRNGTKHPRSQTPPRSCRVDRNRGIPLETTSRSTRMPRKTRVLSSSQTHAGIFRIRIRNHARIRIRTRKLPLRSVGRSVGRPGRLVAQRFFSSSTSSATSSSSKPSSSCSKSCSISSACVILPPALGGL